LEGGLSGKNIFYRVRSYAYEWDNPNQIVPDTADYIIIAHSKKEADLLAERFCHKTGIRNYKVEASHLISEEMKGLYAYSVKELDRIHRGIEMLPRDEYEKLYVKQKEEWLKKVKVRRPGIYKPRGREPIFE